MSNVIRIDDTTPTEEWLCMSNGTIDVFIDVLTLSSSALAKAEQEKLLTVWLAEKDQAVVGLGTVGFDLCEMPWTAEGFVQEREFLCRIIDAAIVPMSTGRIYLGGEEIESGEEMTLCIGGDTPQTIVTLTVEENGMTQDYTLLFQDTVNYMVGDVDDNWMVDATDAAAVLVYAAEIGAGADPVLPDELWYTRADATYDGVVDSTDAAEILYIAAIEGAGSVVG